MKKKILFAVDILLLSLLLCAFGFAENPKTVVKGYLESAKKYDTDSMQNYIYQENVFESTETEVEEDSLYSAVQAIIKEYNVNLDYEILECSSQDDTAYVNVEITFTDLQPVITSAMDNVVSGLLLAALSDEDLDDDGTENLFLSAIELQLSITEIQTQTETITIELTKKSGSWKIVSSDELSKATTCNVTNALEDYNPLDIFNDDNNDEADSSLSFNSNCVNDELGLIEDTETVLKSLMKFFDSTGIQPYIYLKKYDSSLASSSDMDDYTANWYEENIDNEITFLFIFFEGKSQSQDYFSYVCGYDIDSIMDEEAINTFWDLIDEYWYSESDVGSAISIIFEGTAEAIMQ